MDYPRLLVYSTGACRRLGNHSVDRFRAQWIRGRAMFFCKPVPRPNELDNPRGGWITRNGYVVEQFYLFRAWIVASAMDNGNSQGMISSEAFLEICF